MGAPRRWTRGRASRRWSRPCAPSSARWRRSADSIPDREAMVDEAVEIPAWSPGSAAPLCGEARRWATPARRWPTRQHCSTPSGRRGPGRLVEPTGPEQVVRFLTNPLVSPLLLSLAFWGWCWSQRRCVRPRRYQPRVPGILRLRLLLGLAGWEEVLLRRLGWWRLRSRRLCCRASASPACWASAVAAAMVLAMMGRRRRPATWRRRSRSWAPAW
jgi:hypothetical protein